MRSRGMAHAALQRSTWALVVLIVTGGGVPGPAPTGSATPDPGPAAVVDSTRLPAGWLVGAGGYVLSTTWNPPNLCFLVLNVNQPAPAFQDLVVWPHMATIAGISGTGAAGQSLTMANGYCYNDTSGPAGSKGCYAQGGGPGSTLTVCVQLSGVSSSTSMLGTANINTGTRQTVGSITWMPPATVTVMGSKWQDFNGNGVRDPEDTPYPGAVLFVDQDSDGLLGPSEQSGTSASDGSFSIPNLPTSGTYPLGENRTSPGSVLTYPPGGTHSVDLSNPSTPYATYQFANFLLVQVSGYWKYARWGSAGVSCPFGQQANTAGTVCEPCPAGSPCANPPDQVLVNPVLDGAYPAPSSFTPFSVPLNGGSWTAGDIYWGTYLFEPDDPQVGLLDPSTGSFFSGDNQSLVNSWYRHGSVQTNVWQDLNRNSAWDPGEPPLADVPVEVNWWGGSSSTVQTNEFGVWEQTGALPGTTVTVTIDPPPGSWSDPYSTTFMVESGVTHVLQYPVGYPWSFTVEKREDLWGDGVANPGDPPMPGIDFCIAIDPLQGCSQTDTRFSTGPDGFGTAMVSPHAAGTVALLEQWSGAEGYATYPPGGQTTFDLSVPGPDPAPYTFLNTRYSSLTGQPRMSRYDTWPPGPQCPPGQWSTPDGTGCEPCPAGPGGAFCATPFPFDVTLVPAPGCTHCPPADFTPPLVKFSGGTLNLEGLKPGEYVGTTPMPGYTIRTETFSLPSGTRLQNQAFWLSTNSTTAGRVFVDTNGDGSFGTGDTGVPDARLQLYEDPSTTSFFDVFTDAGGAFPPTIVAPGTTVRYTITPPPGYTINGTSTGSYRAESGGLFDPQTPVQPTNDGTITAFKFVDFDGDGDMDSFDPGLNGVTFRLTGPTGGQTEAVSSDRAPGEPGYAVFTGLGPGTYTLREVAPEGFTPTVPPSGSYTVTLLPGIPSGSIYLFGNAPGALDFGDALQAVDPAHPQFPSGYPVTAAANGARHLPVPSVMLGDYLDIEAEGRPQFLALGDDTFPNAMPDDEDGVGFIDPFGSASIRFDPGPPDPVRIPVLARNRMGRMVFRPSVRGRIEGWVDWNRDGDWSDDGETVFRSAQVESPSDTLFLTVPGTAASGFTYARFRFHTGSSLEATGPAVGGEVEDFVVLVTAPVPVGSTADTPDAAPGDGVCADAMGACTLRAALEEAAAGGGVYVIDLGAAGKSGAAVFRPTSALPVVRASVEIVGSQATLDGSLAGDASGLVLETDGATVHSLTVQGFERHGIVIAGSDNEVRNSRVTGNGGDGIRVESGRINVLSGNTYADNGGLGINLAAPSDPVSGVTVNDVADGDTGANDLLNTPVLSLVTAENGRVVGTTTCASCAVELYSNAECDPSGYGEGETFVDSFITLADGSFEILLAAALDIGTPVSAILRDREGNTSEFSECVAAVTTGLEEPGDTDLPGGYELFQNYPNPFNPTTAIEFSVPEPVSVRLIVYDVLGRPVARLVDATIPSGRHAAVFDAAGLTTGIYVYRLHTPLGVLSRSLVLMK